MRVVTLQKIMAHHSIQKVVCLDVPADDSMILRFLPRARIPSRESFRSIQDLKRSAMLCRLKHRSMCILVRLRRAWSQTLGLIATTYIIYIYIFTYIIYTIIYDLVLKNILQYIYNIYKPYDYILQYI